MKKMNIFFGLVIGAYLLSAPTTGLEAKHKKTVGEKLDSAIDSTEEKAKEVKQKIKKTTSKGIDKAQKGLDNTQKKLDD